MNSLAVDIKTTSAPIIPEQQKHQTRWDLLSEQVLSYSLAKEHISFALECRDMLSPQYQRVVDLVSKKVKQVEDKEADELLHRITLASALLPEESEGILRNHLKKEYIGVMRKKLVEAVQKAEASKDNKTLQEALHALSSFKAQ